MSQPTSYQQFQADQGRSALYLLALVLIILGIVMVLFKQYGGVLFILLGIGIIKMANKYRHKFLEKVMDNDRK